MLLPPGWLVPLKLFYSEETGHPQVFNDFHTRAQIHSDTQIYVGGVECRDLPAFEEEMKKLIIYPTSYFTFVHRTGTAQTDNIQVGHEEDVNYTITYLPHNLFLCFS